jgi:transcriptional regulator with XRE-family HTH domain
MQHVRTQLAAYMAQKGWSQEQLAKAAEVSQATVCRALSKDGRRHGAARAKLFKYVGISELPPRQALGDARELIVAAFERVWDQSEEHAVAVVKVIDALAGLRPLSKDEKGAH